MTDPQSLIGARQGEVPADGSVDRTDQSRMVGNPHLI